MTIAQLMAIVLYLGTGFAALRNATEFWASATLTLAAAIVLAATLGAFARKGTRRFAWAGFAAFGWTCALTEWLSFLAMRQYAPPPMLVLWGFRTLQPYIQPSAAGGDPYIRYYQISISLEVVLFGVVGAIVGRLVAAEVDRPNP
jgi:hypothetical protein